MELYRGVVEDNKHPDKNGKVRVRIFGLHTENNENSSETFETISTEQLPWAEVMGGNEFGLLSGIGTSSILKQGTWVWVTLDNDDPNKPIILGVVKGTQTVKKQYSDGEGFCDPDGEFPLDPRLGQTDLNELARGIIENTVIATKNNNLDSSPYYTEAAQQPSSYTYNQVIETPSGHVIELDDTPGSERVQIIDRHGNYTEMKLDEYIDKAVSKKVNIIVSNLLEHIGGGVKRKVDKDFYNTIAGYFRIQADGNLEIIGDVKVSGSLQTTGQITASSSITSGGDVADSQGNLSSLRDAYDAHWHVNIGSSAFIPQILDPKTRAGDFSWSNTPLGFD